MANATKLTRMAKATKAKATKAKATKAKATNEPKADLYERVTSQIVAMLEQGVKPWVRPWKVDIGPGNLALPLRANGQSYQGVNVLTLWAVAMDRNYSSPYWLTYKQAQDEGAQVRKGEKGTLVVYAGRTVKMDRDDETGEERARAVYFLRGYTVFNANQVDGLSEKYATVASPEPLDSLDRIAHAERFIEATGAEILIGGDRACYVPSADVIRLPHRQLFLSAETYYGTALHELIHWTGTPARCNRTLSTRFGSNAYAVEELIAELGASFACASLGIAPQAREDHASYLASWLKVLKADKRAIFQAASAAQVAVNYLHGLQGYGEPESDPDGAGEAEGADDTAMELEAVGAAL